LESKHTHSDGTVMLSAAILSCESEAGSFHFVATKTYNVLKCLQLDKR